MATQMVSVCIVLQVMALLKAAGGQQGGEGWDQGEQAETIWAEMGLQPDAHITQVVTPTCSRTPCFTPWLVQHGKALWGLWRC